MQKLNINQRDIILIKKKIKILALILLVFAGSYLANEITKKIVLLDSTNNDDFTSSAFGSRDYKRIISLAPNITETIFALGLGDRIVGVTRFCKYPPEAVEKEKVGGFMDPNYEAIAALKPDLVILLPEHENIQKYINELGLKSMVVHNRSIDEILDTIITIGKVCSVEESAHELLSKIKSRMKIIKDKTAGKKRPRVLISIGRTMGYGSLKKVYISGKNTFFDELITYAGGVNVYERHDVAYPNISGEGMLYLNPEVIIDLVPDSGEKNLNETMIIKEWTSFSDVNAVRNNRVHVLNQDYMVIPGPRFILLLEDLARILHPEIEWD